MQYLYRFHLYTTMALQSEHTHESLAELGRVGNGLLKCLQECPLMDVRPSLYLFVVSYLDKESGEITIILSRLSLEVVDRPFFSGETTE